MVSPWHHPNLETSLYLAFFFFFFCLWFISWVIVQTQRKERNKRDNGKGDEIEKKMQHRKIMGKEREVVGWGEH
ncbi:hypothetical protein DM01DRAFT_6305 [Hesseltinella vesiculosa]|uniref:Uncharacterized protein n=1 Tax=Hesseltinella vesiculosa TaxID=101127 RepID=A0A1X2GSX8_9FUNG|nr:hypothetical protein DM01DRAFT_6305 [Hesseltinella vesiculosa]